MSDLDFDTHKQLRLENFTAFSDETFEFVPGINVFLGENGTGKTHVMKALYAWQMARHLVEKNQNAKYDQLFTETYGTTSISELQRTKSKIAKVSGSFGGNAWAIGLQENTSTDNGVRPKVQRPVFIPAMEMMAHARNMNGILRDYADFDRTCFDFLAMVTAQPLSARKSTPLKEMANLEKLIPGEVEWNDDEQRFYLHEKGKRLPFQLVAEGFRKISALNILVKSEWIQPGSVLFWDEPEVNLNPKWMDEVIEALVALARNHVQIFLATHNYVILKEIDLALRKQQSQDNVQARFFSLYKERGVSKVMWTDDFAMAEPNPILDQYDQMLSEDLRLQNWTNGVHKGNLSRLRFQPTL